MAQCCQEQYLRNIRNIQMPMESKDHTLKMASDVRYWQKHMQTSHAILDLYTKEIEVLERVLSQHISLTQAAIQIGGFRRIFNRHRGMLPYRNWDTNHLGRKRYTLTGIPNPYADVFHVIPIQNVQARPGRDVRMVSPAPATSESSRERADGGHGGTQVTGAVRTGDWRYA